MAKEDWVPVDEKSNRAGPKRPRAEETRAADRLAAAQVEWDRQTEMKRRTEERAKTWVDDLLRKIDRDEANEERARQARDMARTGFNLSAPIPAPLSTGNASSIKVGDEVSPYGPGSSHSYFRDRYLDAAYGYSAALPARGDHISDVRHRLATNQRQVGWLAGHGTNEQRAIIRSYLNELYRPYHDTVSDHAREDWRHLCFTVGMEQRDSSTGSGSLGTLVPPVFILERFQLFRTAASPVASQAGQAELPRTGMTAQVPTFASGVSMAVQSGENTSIGTSSPTAAYATANVETIAGAVEVSQQYLDRVGPGVTGDEIIAAQAAREAATQLDALAITAVLANATTITNSGSPSVAALFADVGKASAAIATTEGTRLHPSHVMLPSANAEWFMAQTDTDGRPVWMPSAAATLARVGQVNTRDEGYSGYDISGKMVFADDNLPAGPSPTYSTVLVGDLPNGLLVMTGTPIVDVMPEFDPATLTAIITIRMYAALSVLYPSAFQQITGPAYLAAPVFAGA
jgi:HK97 family phage major capsid protein